MPKNNGPRLWPLSAGIIGQRNFSSKQTCTQAMKQTKTETAKDSTNEKVGSDRET